MNVGIFKSTGFIGRNLRQFLFQEHTDNNNIYNLVLQESINNEKFTRAFTKAVKKPVFLSIPEFALKAIIGKGAEILTKCQFVCPKRLINKSLNLKKKIFKNFL